jgi:hypothetical protein
MNSIFFAISLLWSSQIFAQEFVPPLSEWRNAKHVEFKKITPTKYSFSTDSISAEVESSASALVLPFKAPQKFSGMKVRLSFENSMSAFDANLRLKKGGDDFVLRMGLLIHGKAPWIPFMAADWVKMLQTVMIHPSGNMIYQVAALPNELPSTWVSPYSDSILNERMSCVATSASEWECVSKFEAREIVGLWLMSDGDDLKLKNKVVVKSLILQ